MHYFRSSRYIVLVLILGIAAFAKAAIIAPDPPAFTLQMHSNIGTYDVPIGSITPIPNGDTWKYEIDGAYSRGGYDVTYSFTIDPDPSIVGNFSIRNNTTSLGDYTMSFNLPVNPGFNPSQLSGSVGVTVSRRPGSTRSRPSFPDRPGGWLRRP